MPDPHPASPLEIAHVLFMDMVGSSKLLINEQSDQLRRLNEIVRNTAQVRSAEAAGKLVRLPTGDGMALVFFTAPDAPVRCAMEIAEAMRGDGPIPLRMGIHSGPVEEVVDVNERANIAGAGITLAQRVMDCGDAGHILLSKRIADDLGQYGSWKPYLHPLGLVEVKHGEKIEVVNFYDEKSGNPALPDKFVLPAQREKTAVPHFAPIAVAVLILAGAISWLVIHHRTHTAPPSAVTPGEKRIAVLPFKPIIAENRDPVLELGMADTLIAKLSNMRSVVVTSLNAVRKYTALDQDTRAAGRELQVNAVLEGDVQRSGDHIRVSARLINVADGAALWSDTFDEKFTDVFGVQDAISERVAAALVMKLTDEEKGRLTKRYTESADAYQLYMTGRYHFSRLVPAEIRSAIDFFQKALVIDPHYALAYVGEADAYRSLAITSDVPAKQTLPKAIEANRKAIALDPSLAEAHASLSFCLMWFDCDWTGAEREAQRAISLDPNSGLGHYAYAHVLSNLGRHEAALPEMQRAVNLEPTSLLYQALYGMLLLNAGRVDEAMAQLQHALDLDPNFWIAHLTLGKVFLKQGRYSEAISEFDQARDQSHGNSETIASAGYAAAMAGDRAKAEAIVNELKKLEHEAYVPPVNYGLVQLGLGNTTEALASLDRAIEEHDVRLTLLKVDPRWDALRADPRFGAILQRIGLQ